MTRATLEHVGRRLEPADRRGSAALRRAVATELLALAGVIKRSAEVDDPAVDAAVAALAGVLVTELPRIAAGLHQGDTSSGAARL